MLQGSDVKLWHRPKHHIMEPSHEAARELLLLMQVNGMLLEGKKVFVGPFLKRTDRPADKEAHYTNIYVKNLAESVTEEQLDKMFGDYGKVCCCIILLGSAVQLVSAKSYCGSTSCPSAGACSTFKSA